MNNRLVTVFGGGGFLGRYIVQDLLKAGARVRVAERDPRDAWFLKPLGGLGQIQFVAADVLRPDTVTRAVEGADAVVNLVGTFGPGMAKVHADGAGNIAVAAARLGVNAMVHVSAIGADADSPSAYGRSKADGEAAVRKAFPSATILRPSVVFGREDAFVNRFASMISRMPVVPVLRAKARFQPVYVADVAAAVTTVMKAPGDHAGKTYALGGPDILTMGELIRWIAAQIGRNRPIAEIPDELGPLIAMLPGTPITTDQWRMLQQDNIVGEQAGFPALGITPTPLSSVASEWLVQYRRNGRFSRHAKLA